MYVDRLTHLVSAQSKGLVKVIDTVSFLSLAECR